MEIPSKRSHLISFGQNMLQEETLTILGLVGHKKTSSKTSVELHHYFI